MHTEATCVQPMKREEVYEPGNKSHVPQQWMWYHQWVMLIICVVTVITAGAGPHSSLILHVWGHYHPTCECFLKLTCKHKPLFCRSPHWGSPRNASSETCPTQTVVSCPAEREIDITFILVQIDPSRFRVKFSVFTYNNAPHPLLWGSQSQKAYFYPL